MKKLGLVGGIGPESTLDYYKGIITGCRARTGGAGYPLMVIDSLDLDVMYNLADKQQWEPFTDRLVASVQTLAAAGAEVAAMAANTAHIVFDRVRERSPLPLISIVEETCKFAEAKGCKKVIVFGTGFTMSSGMYTDAFARYGIEAFIPTPEEQRAIHGVIFPNLQEGIVLPEEKRLVLDIAGRMIVQTGADALILGCTELPLIIKQDDLDVLALDTTQIHIDAIVDYISG
ncbi:MAG: aspartate/glutamate racemase family protein [Bacillota bacterium]